MKYIYIYTWIFERTQISIRLQDFCPKGGFLAKDLEMVVFWLVWSILYFAPFGLIVLYFAQNMSIFLGGNSREKGGNSRPDSTWLKNEKMKCQFFLEMVIFILKWRNLKKWTEIRQKSALDRNLWPMNIQVLDVCSIHANV